MSVNNHHGHVPGGSSIPRRPSQQSGQQNSNAKWSAVPPNRLESISKQNTEQYNIKSEPLAAQGTDKPESSMPVEIQDTNKPELSVPLAVSNSGHSYDIEKRILLEEMATTKLDVAQHIAMPQPHTPIVWKKIKVSYTATVNVRKGKKRGHSQKNRVSSPAY